MSKAGHDEPKLRDVYGGGVKDGGDARFGVYGGGEAEKGKKDGGR